MSDLQLANAKAMVRRAVKIIENLMPGISYTTVNVGELNDWLLASRQYTGDSKMECPDCGEVALAPQLGSDEMWECESCHLEVQI